jgi:gliding motility-associated protein GldC
MKKSEINFKIQLDKNNIPETIQWNATDKLGDLDHTKAIAIGIWDDVKKNTMRLDLWTKEMPIDEMKMFYINILSGIAQTILSATGDEKMANEITDFCNTLGKELKKNNPVLNKFQDKSKVLILLHLLSQYQQKSKSAPCLS